MNTKEMPLEAKTNPFDLTPKQNRPELRDGFIHVSIKIFR
jgi:hypothetical protein